MAKHKDTPPLADWEVTYAGRRTAVIAQSWYERAKGGGYAFHDEQGICYDFPPGIVDLIRRAPEVVHNLTGYAPGRHGGVDVGCVCGLRIAGTSRENAEELIAAHVANPDREPGWDYSEAAR